MSFPVRHQCLLTAYCAHTGHSLALRTSRHQTLCFLARHPVSVTPGHRIPTAMGPSLKGSSLPLLEATSPSPAQIHCPWLRLYMSPPSPQSLPFAGDHVQEQTSSWRPRLRGRKRLLQRLQRVSGTTGRWPPGVLAQGLPGGAPWAGPRSWTQTRTSRRAEEGPGPGAESGASRQSRGAGVRPSPADDCGARVTVRLDSWGETQGGA